MALWIHRLPEDLSRRHSISSQPGGIAFCSASLFTVVIEGRFQRIYAAVFLTVLLAALGGGLCVWGAKSAIASEESYLRRDGVLHDKSRDTGLFRIFYVLGIRDWRAQFGIGAAVGAGGALLFLKKYRDANTTDR